MLKTKGIQIKYSSEKLYPIEIEQLNSPAGNRIPAYFSERTLCEIMTVKAATDIQVITYAIKSVNLDVLL